MPKRNDPKNSTLSNLEANIIKLENEHEKVIIYLFNANLETGTVQVKKTKWSYMPVKLKGGK